MNRTIFSIMFAICSAIIIMNLGNYKGKFYELTAPKVTKATLNKSTLNFETQSLKYLEFEYLICKSFTPCSASTMNLGPDQIIEICKNSLEKLKEIKIDNQMPEDVKTNMNIFLTSMMHSVQRNINRNEIHHSNKRGDGRGETMMSPLKNWEIDTCTEKSIPQKLRTIYGFVNFSDKKIIDCNDITKQYESLNNSTLKNESSKTERP
jgi:hypothetical protein